MNLRHRPVKDGELCSLLPFYRTDHHAPLLPAKSEDNTSKLFPPLLRQIMKNLSGVLKMRNNTVRTQVPYTRFPAPGVVRQRPLPLLGGRVEVGGTEPHLCSVGAGHPGQR